MAPENRTPAQHLSFLADAAPTVKRWGLFPLLRRLEAMAAHLPRIGRSKLPTQNIVQLSQMPNLGFAPSTLDSIAAIKGRAHVSGHWLGLLGPMGPLPVHLTEYAHYEARYSQSRPFNRFLELLSERMLQFFYRAWANSQPVAIADRPNDDRFAAFLGYLSGAAEGVDDRSAFPKRARLHYAGLFASRRSAVAIEDGLASLLGQSLRLREYQPRWQVIEQADRSRLGVHFCTLGEDAMLGSRVRTVTDAFRVEIRASSLRDYESLLPTGQRFGIAAEALDAFAPSHLEWDLAVEIAQDDAPAARLNGRARLGWTSWLGKGEPGLIRKDAHLRRSARFAN